MTLHLNEQTRAKLDRYLYECESLAERNRFTDLMRELDAAERIFVGEWAVELLKDSYGTEHEPREQACGCITVGDSLHMQCLEHYQE